MPADHWRIVFAGTPDFAVPALRALLGGTDPVVGVFTQPDRPAGRGRRLTASPVKRLALAQGLKILQPNSLKGAAAQQELRELGPDLLVVAAYGLILPAAVLETPRLGCINVHASLLPRWRGAAPIQRALLAGDRETGITIMQMDQGLDTGDMLLRKPWPIAADATGGSLHDQLAALGAEALREALAGLRQGRLRRRAQDPGQATYAAKLEKQEAWIDWAEPAEAVERRIRAFDPWPVAQTLWGETRLRLWRSRVIERDHRAEPGQVLGADAAGVAVACGRGQLSILELQLPGRRRITAADFVHAHDLRQARFVRPSALAG